MTDLERKNAARLLIDTCDGNCEGCCFYKSVIMFDVKTEMCEIMYPKQWGKYNAEDEG